MCKLGRLGIHLVYAALLLGASGPLSAQTYTTLANFNFTDGNVPIGGLVQGTDGNFYGTTAVGGVNVCKVDRTHNHPNGTNTGCGTIFKMTPSGALTSLHSFDGTDGEYPESGVIQGKDGNFYGTTQSGGAVTTCDATAQVPGCGAIFKITSSGTFTSLHIFDGTDGAIPARKLVQGTDGNFYGATGDGGANGDGTIFKITPSGTLTTLHNFDGADGAGATQGLALGTDGNFYGVTGGGGTYGAGTIFKVTPSGTLTTLHSFCASGGYCSDGSDADGLVQGANGNFYGTTTEGGTGGGADNIPSGTAFEITPSGKFTTLFSFNNQNNQSPGFPLPGALVLASDGNFYGFTLAGGNGNVCGTAGCGTLYKMTPAGTITVVYDFQGQPDPGLIQGANGDFYAETDSLEGGGDYGSIYSLSVGLRPL
jgi:uncharacterized repeat protein (TIGR03803 family)